MSYAELHCLSNFTFLRGASHPEELVERAQALGYTALAITDECSVAGVVRAHVSAKNIAKQLQSYTLKIIVGAEFRLECGTRFLALATNRAGYGRLCRLITRGRRAAEKGEYSLTRADVESLLDQCLLLWLPDMQPNIEAVQWLAERFPGNVWIAVELLFDGANRERLTALTKISQATGLPLIASGDVHMHVRERRALQDTVTAIRLNVPITQAGWHLYPNGERYLRELSRLKHLYPGELLDATLAIAERCTFSLDELRYEYPHELVPEGETPKSYLRKLTEEGASQRWPHGVPPAVRQQIEKELEIIADLRYEPYFLTVQDLVAFARQRKILCQGRGSAANSVVCYCLYVTEVDPERSNLVVERFISRERAEPPDIDIDFEHERREEVIQYVYRKYGRERAALAATVIMYRPRSAIRDMGKAFGLDPLQIKRLSSLVQWWDASIPAERVREAGFDPDNPLILRILTLAKQLVGFPRHLSQHVGGFVISEGLLEELVPIENATMEDRTVVQWDKDDLNDLGLLKVDLLALGMLTALRRGFDLVNQHCGRSYTLGGVPAEDPAVYEMISRADTIGVFQIESRAQMSMLPRLKPRTYYDLVIEVAIVRPGPIQGDMVHPYLRRREKKEEVIYPSEDVRGVLERTLGVPIFQEQVMQLAVVAAGFTPGEADQLRRAMAAWKRRGGLAPFREKLINGMRARNYDGEFAERIFRQIMGFGEYGFPECVTGDTRVVDADTGRWLTIDAVISGQATLKHTFACDENLRLKKRKVLAVKSSGVKPVWKLRTAAGHLIFATAEHPFMTPDGWRKLGQLKVGAQVAAARSLPLSGEQHWPRHQILLLADLLADSSIVRPRTLHFSTSIARYCDEIVETLEQFPNTRAVVEHHEGCYSIIARPIERSQPFGALVWARSLDLKDHQTQERHLPPEAFELRNSDIALLLARLWEGGQRPKVYETSSRRLASEVQHLLLRLGVQARVQCKLRSHKRHRPERYIVTVEGRPSKAHIQWDRIVAIEALGEQPTYDLQIEGDHNFLANNLVVHNSHAASFALLVYDSAWLKHHHPAAFACALLNSQPMGFYAPAQLVRDARDHGVEVRPVRVEASNWDCTLERREDGELALRLGLSLVKSLSRPGADRIVEARQRRPFESVQDLGERAELDRTDLEALAAAGALTELSGNRHMAFWEVAGTEKPVPLAPRHANAWHIEEGRPLLTAPTERQSIEADYNSVGLTLGRHPMALLREHFREEGLVCASDLAAMENGVTVRIAGIVLLRQHPMNAKGVTFMTIEDETGHVNLIIWKNVAEAQRRPMIESRLLEVHGKLQRQEAILHVVVYKLVDRSALAGQLVTQSRDFH
jgi:DNA-directed DNA polymerase III PolC